MTDEERLRREITALCHQIDRRNNKPLGTAEPGLYAWHWDQDYVGVDTLNALHADALILLLTMSPLDAETIRYKLRVNGL